jgi:hypothetical protein
MRSLMTFPESVVAAALMAYAGGFLVTFVWARVLHQRHGLTDRGAAIQPALVGAALGGTCTLLICTADQIDLFGV